MHDSKLAYTIQGEHITCELTQPNGTGYDVRTFPQRVDAELAALRAEVATLRAVVAELVEALDEIGVQTVRIQRHGQP